MTLLLRVLRRNVVMRAVRVLVLPVPGGPCIRDSGQRPVRAPLVWAKMK